MTGFKPSSMDAVLEHLLVHYRWVFVIFLLPASFLYDVWAYARTWLVFRLNSAPSKHDSKVQEVAQQVKRWRSEGNGQKMCTARPGWQTMGLRQPKYKKTLYNIRVNLVDILELNAEKQTVRVEPMVSMGQLTALLDPLGWTLPVLPELDDLTVGGLVMGTGVESSSHKHGLFQHFCVSYELVLADGSIVECSKDKDPDLFYAVPWSFGTLGFVTAIEMKIIPALRFVKLEYEPVYSLEEAVSVFHRQTTLESGNEFVEGFMFSKNEGIVMTGNMTSYAELNKLNEIGKWYKPWFFEHARTFLTKGRGVEYLPLRDYQHRHTKGMFWEMGEIVPFGNNPIFRFLYGWMMPPKVSFLKLTQTKAIGRLYDNNHIIEDMLVPIDTLKESIELFDKEVKVYPLWLCPFRVPSEPGMLYSDKDVTYVDVGLYGVPKKPNYDPVYATRALEAHTLKAKGFQLLCSDTYLTKEEFRQMFNHDLYDKMRKRLNCEEAFPDVFEKVNRQARE